MRQAAYTSGFELRLKAAITGLHCRFGLGAGTQVGSRPPSPTGAEDVQSSSFADHNLNPIVDHRTFGQLHRHRLQKRVLDFPQRAQPPLPHARAGTHVRLETARIAALSAHLYRRPAASHGRQFFHLHTFSRGFTRARRAVRRGRRLARSVTLGQFPSDEDGRIGTTCAGRGIAGIALS